MSSVFVGCGSTWIDEPARHGQTRDAMCILAMLNLNSSLLQHTRNTNPSLHAPLYTFSESPADDLHEELSRNRPR